MSTGPLRGIKVIELAGIGAGPMCAMLLADLGADVIRVDRPGGGTSAFPSGYRYDLLNRSRPSVSLDLSTALGLDALLRLIDQADAFIDPFRPGVAERLGVGPDVCLVRNPRLVYGRVTGWGQDGPLRDRPGHDINFISLTGALHSFGPEDGPPTPPLNLVGNYGGGALYLAFGICAAIIERGQDGLGQVVDAAMIDGAASLMTMYYGLSAAGDWHNRRGTNSIDTGSHFYTTYETADGRWVSVGAVEAKFHAALLAGLGLTTDDIPDQWDETRWAEHKRRLGGIFRTRTRDDWCERLGGSEACVAPVLSLDEAPHHPQLRARRTFVEVDGIVQPAPAPRFSRTPGRIQGAPAAPGGGAEGALARWGLRPDDIAQLIGGRPVAEAEHYSV